jgi:hypothetical protein
MPITVDDRVHHDATECLKCLRDAVAGTPVGPLGEGCESSIRLALGAAWPYLCGSDAESTSESKLYRAEDLTWAPPSLTFVLERHGGTVNGSSRGALHHWAVDPVAETATIYEVSHRQLYPMAKRLDTKALAQSIADLVVEGSVDERLAWNDAKSRVTVALMCVIPETNIQTTRARRKRFREALESALRPRGWLRAEAGTRLIFEVSGSISSATPGPEGP